MGVAFFFFLITVAETSWSNLIQIESKYNLQEYLQQVLSRKQSYLAVVDNWGEIELIDLCRSEDRHLFICFLFPPKFFFFQLKFLVFFFYFRHRHHSHADAHTHIPEVFMGHRFFFNPGVWGEIKLRKKKVAIIRLLKTVFWGSSRHFNNNNNKKPLTFFYFFSPPLIPPSTCVKVIEEDEKTSSRPSHPTPFFFFFEN